MSNSYQLKPGAVLKLFVNDTNPPKIKRFIIIGYDTEKILLATVYINSKINKHFAWSLELEALHLMFEAKGRSYLDRNSWIDCSELVIRGKDEIYQIIASRSDVILGYVNDEDFNLILQTLRQAPTIKGKIKKRFGLFDKEE